MDQMSRLIKSLLTASMMMVMILLTASCQKAAPVRSVQNASENPQLSAVAGPALSVICNAPGGIRIDWQKTAGVENYRVLRLGADGSWQTVGDTAELYYIDRNVVSGNRYTYTVAALSADGGSIEGEYDKTGLSFTYIYNYDAYAADAPDIIKKEDVVAAGKRSGLDDYEIKALVGWQESEYYYLKEDPYLAYLAACTKVNAVLDGIYGRSREFADQLELRGSEFSPNAQKERYDNASADTLKAVYLALNNPLPGIYSCRGTDGKPINCFYDPGMVIQGQSVYVW